MELGEIYGQARRRMGELARSMSDEELAAKLPTCPDWSARDVIGHVTGLLADILGNRMEGAGTSAWTAGQVAAYAHRSLEEVLADWEALAEGPEADLAGIIGPFAPRLLSDLYAHEQDIRGAAGRPGHRDDPAVVASLEVQLPLFTQRLDAAGLPALRLRAAGGGEWVVGSAEAAATVSIPSAWELLRAVQARRSPAQVAAYGWEGEGPDRYLGEFFRFPPPTSDISE